MNLKNNVGVTALIKAVAARNSKYMEVLLKAEAVVNITDNEGNTALMNAGHECFWDMKCFKLLLTAGANVNIVSKEGYTVLQHVSIKGNFYCMKLLPLAEMDINKTTRQGDTAFMLAAENADFLC